MRDVAGYWARAAGSVALAAIVALFLSCGTLGGSKGGEEGLPDPGGFGWVKLDLDSTLDLSQPFILYAGDEETAYREPWAVEAEDGRIFLYFEKRIETFGSGFDAFTSIPLSSAILVSISDRLDRPEIAAGGEPVVAPTLSFEGEFAGSPCVLVEGGAWRMWYGTAGGIGYAEADDGIHFTKRPEPVLIADQNWEAGRVGSPTVLRAAPEEPYRMWYEATGRAAIGYAESADGLHWTKKDASGRTSGGGERDLEPVVVPDQEWEAGAVHAPMVLVRQSSVRRIFQMYYTGEIGDSQFRGNASIGFAGSLDGLTWDKAEATNPLDPFLNTNPNPVLSEYFSTDLGGLDLSTIPLLGDLLAALGLTTPVEDFLSILSASLVFHEEDPFVLRRGKDWVLLYYQSDALNFDRAGLKILTLGTGQPPSVKRGLSLATTPRKPDVVLEDLYGPAGG